MVVGAPGLAFINRIKVLGLLFDELLLEEGLFEFTLGDEAGIEGPAKSERWTTAAERAGRRHKAGELVVTSPGGVEKSRFAMRDAYYWRATHTYSHVIPALGRAAAEQMDAVLGPRPADVATG
jgi:hypothetical protein